MSRCPPPSKASGLGGDPYRDGSYAYYIGEKIATNDPKGVGAFLLAASEMETAQNAKLGRGRTVLVDGWFNSQQRTDAFGQQVYFHYKWDTCDEPRLLALRPHLPQLRRQNSGTRRGAHGRQSRRRAGLRHRFAR